MQMCHRFRLDGGSFESDVSMPAPRAFASLVLVPKWGVWILGGYPDYSMVMCMI